MTEKEEHRGRLLGACLHAIRDETSESWLVGLELPETQFAGSRDRDRAISYLDGLIGQMRDLFIRVWDDINQEK